MTMKFSKKPLALALGAAFGLTGAAQASVFQISDLSSGYMVAQATPATPAMPAKKAGELHCGAGCMDEAKGMGMNDADAKAACQKAHAEGKCGGSKAKKTEGKCGEGKCGADKMGKKTEGKCGEGKCGGNK